MRVSEKTLEILQEIINGDGSSNYRSGPMLVSFFNDLGFNDIYGQGFPSRRVYTAQKLEIINGTPELDKCIKKAFAVIDYIENISNLDDTIKYFNKYLAFDKWQVVRDNDIITFKKLERVVVESVEKPLTNTDEDAFLNKTFSVNIDGLHLEQAVLEVLKQRIVEVERCINQDAPLSAVIMIGGILEGVLLGVSAKHPKEFNQTNCAPKNPDGTVRKFSDWTLNNFIDVASELGMLNRDVKKFSHVVRDFRNYIHPYSQLATKFSPDKHTALICFQVLKAAICQIDIYENSN